MARKKQTLADKVIEYRCKNNLSQRQFAKQAGVSRVTLRKVEIGKTNLQKAVAARIMRSMGQSVDLSLLN